VKSAADAGSPAHRVIDAVRTRIGAGVRRIAAIARFAGRLSKYLLADGTAAAGDAIYALRKSVQRRARPHGRSAHH
jgi:hypothetical protein